MWPYPVLFRYSDARSSILGELQEDLGTTRDPPARHQSAGDGDEYDEDDGVGVHMPWPMLFIILGWMCGGSVSISKWLN